MTGLALMHRFFETLGRLYFGLASTVCCLCLGRFELVFWAVWLYLVSCLAFHGVARHLCLYCVKSQAHTPRGSACSLPLPMSLILGPASFTSPSLIRACKTVAVQAPPTKVTQCMFDVGPASATLDQHQTYNGWTFFCQVSRRARLNLLSWTQYNGQISDLPFWLRKVHYFISFVWSLGPMLLHYIDTVSMADSRNRTTHYLLIFNKKFQ